RNAVLRSFSRTAPTSRTAPGSKYRASYQYRIDVPLDSPRFIFPVTRSPDAGVNGAFGPAPSKTPGSPLRNDIWWTLRSCLTVTSSRRDSAFTADAPTPCRPPDVLYP